MKALVALVLLCFFLFMVEGGERDMCTRAGDAIESFVDMRSCRESKRTARRISRQLSSTVRSNNLTVEGFQDVLATYCSTVFPARIQCFRGHLQNCSEDQRAYLTGVLDQTGFVCQPNTTSTHPYFSQLLQRLTDEDLQLDEDCFEAKLRDIEETCSREVLASVGFTRREFSDFMRNATVEEFIPYVPRVLNGLYECTVGGIRDQPNRCAQWQGLALKYVISEKLLRSQMITIPGNTMTFTQSQLLQMFELDELQDEGSVENPILVLRGDYV